MKLIGICSERSEALYSDAFRTEGGKTISRSYKKHPILKNNGKSRKYGEKLANRKVRHMKLDSGKSNYYKRCYDSWDVCDGRFYGHKKDDTNDYLDWWKKIYHRK